MRSLYLLNVIRKHSVYTVYVVYVCKYGTSICKPMQSYVFSFHPQFKKLRGAYYVYRLLVISVEEKRPVGQHRHRWDNIKNTLKSRVGCCRMD